MTSFRSLSRHLPLLTTVLLLLLPRATEAQETRRLAGQVFAEGEALSGAQVTVEGTGIGTVTDEQGRFSLDVPREAVRLRIRSIGYRTEVVDVPATQGSVEVELTRDVLNLEEIVVTGRATGVSRRNLANSVEVVNAEELDRTSTSTVEQALQGKLTGAVIRNNSGAPGGGLSVELRGLTSIIGNRTPLYVVDGVIVSNAAIEPGLNTVNLANPGAGLTTTQENPVNRIADLNPRDIETVEVLKGPSAAAIYGSKAAGGVVIITTKKGQSATPRVSLNQQFGFNTLADKVGFREFKSVEEAVSVFGPTAAEHFQPGRAFDHEEALFGREALSWESNLSVRGGAGSTGYFASVLARNEQGIVPNTFANKQSLRLNLDHTVSERLDFALGAQLIRNENDRGLTNNDNSGRSLYGALTGTPTFFDLRPGADGSFPVNPFSGSNPLQTVELFENAETAWRLIGTGSGELEVVRTPTHSLRLIGAGGVDFFSQENDVVSPPELHFEGDDGLPGTLVKSRGENLQWNVNANLVHELTLGGVQATTSAGVQYEWREQDLIRNLSQGLVGGLTTIDAGTVQSAIQARQIVKDFGVFVQEEVLLDERLLLTAGLRVDQSSSNGDTDQFFAYPKAAASYNFRDVGLSWLDEVKLRAAYGESGNQPLFGQKFTILTPANVEGVPTFEIGAVTASPDLKPERHREIEAGVDAVLFGGRARLELTGYRNQVSDLMLQRSLPPSSGFTVQIRNGGEMRILGLEAALDANASLGPVAWNPRVNFSLSRCEITSLPVPTFRPGGFGTSFGEVQLEEGEDCTQVIGTDSLPDGTPTVEKIGRVKPDFLMGLANDFSVRDFSLYFLWDWQQGGRLLNISSWIYDFFANSDDLVTAEDGGLSGSERIAAWPKQSAVYYQDATFLKLREARLAYQLPRSVTAGVLGGIESVRLSISGRNLLRFDRYRDSDPEFNQVPIQNPSSLSEWDIWGYPPSRSFWFSIEATF